MNIPPSPGAPASAPGDPGAHDCASRWRPTLTFLVFADFAHKVRTHMMIKYNISRTASVLLAAVPDLDGRETRTDAEAIAVTLPCAKASDIVYP